MNTQEIKEITLTTQDYNILFSALRDEFYQSYDRQDEDIKKVYINLIENLEKLTSTMNWLDADEIVIGMKKL